MHSTSEPFLLHDTSDIEPELDELYTLEDVLERDRLARVEDNGLYLRNIMNHINDKMVQPVASTILPVISLGFNIVGTLGSLAVGVGFLFIHFR